MKPCSLAYLLTYLLTYVRTGAGADHRLRAQSSQPTRRDGPTPAGRAQQKVRRGGRTAQPVRGIVHARIGRACGSGSGTYSGPTPIWLGAQSEGVPRVAVRSAQRVRGEQARGVSVEGGHGIGPLGGRRGN